MHRIEKNTPEKGKVPLNYHKIGQHLQQQTRLSSKGCNNKNEGNGYHREINEYTGSKHTSYQEYFLILCKHVSENNNGWDYNRPTFSNTRARFFGTETYHVPAWGHESTWFKRVQDGYAKGIGWSNNKIRTSTSYPDCQFQREIRYYRNFGKMRRERDIRTRNIKN